MREKGASSQMAIARRTLRRSDSCEPAPASRPSRQPTFSEQSAQTLCPPCCGYEQVASALSGRDPHS